ncbi:DUF3011 domain-containing protein [Vulcaniibacterium tengchongense]|uniref:DUF3011 family protein n=1 Tax=Vulcaniibacterium tengchongense TaxID=1273429 RepID=A0A3N4VQM5_9GAMM|nr:DUF3011 domain-containing protein [Vulcaniibacterium tengchongense]RPE81501.1 DUF3011 family protein [Vulcaniibacterium tengchongense]
MHAPLVSGLALSALLLAAPASAQYPGGRADVVRCDSNDGRYRECAADTRLGVRLLRQYSKASCIEGRSWGVRRGAVWVDDGCRAEFQLGRGWGGGGPDSGYGGDVGRTVRCDSNDGRYRQCPIGRGRAVLVRQHSRSPCIEGRSWGQRGGDVWVSNGCRAEFASRGGWGGYPGHGGRPDGDWRPGWGEPRTLYCGSDDRRHRRCDVGIRRDARLIRQMSKSPCVEGRSWGWDRAGLWVDEGCRGEFEVY